MRRALIYPLFIIGFMFASLSLGTHVSQAGFIRVGDTSTGFVIEQVCQDGFRITGLVSNPPGPSLPSGPRFDSLYARMYATDPLTAPGGAPVGQDDTAGTPGALPIVATGGVAMDFRSTSVSFTDQFSTTNPTNYWGSADIPWSAPLTNDPYIGIFWGATPGPTVHLANVILRSEVQNCRLFGATPYTDGRLNPTSVFGAIYTTAAGGIQIYGIDNDSEGFPILGVTAAQLASVACAPDENTLIARTNDGRFALYRLTTCEYQVNMGPNAGGQIEVTIFDGVPPSHVYGYSFPGGPGE